MKMTNQVVEFFKENKVLTVAGTIVVFCCYYIYQKSNADTEISNSVSDRIKNGDKVEISQEGFSISKDGINFGGTKYKVG
jgi:hypothetical protein